MASVERADTRDFIHIALLDRNAWAKSRNSEYIPDGEHVWRLWAEHALVFCARAGREILGAAVAFPTLSGPYCVHKVFVEQAHRGRGIGTQLLNALLAEIDALRVPCFLTVDPENESALRLYENLGFTERRFVRGYYREAEDRFVLTRRPWKPT